MPIFGTLFVNLFAGLVAWLAQYFTRKVAFGVAGVTAMSALTLGLYVLMRSTLAGLANPSLGNMPELWVMVLSMSVPPAAPFCFSAYITIWVGCTVYTWQRDLLHILLKV
jgi:hypothetical protein